MSAADVERCAFGQPAAQRPVGLLVAAALPGAVGVAEADLDAGRGFDVGPAGELAALDPGEAAHQPGGLAAQRCGDCVADVGGCVPVPQRPRPRTRSTRVAAALWLACPTIRSPPQWPASLRSWTAAGRSLSGRRSPSGPACSARRLRGLRQRRRGRSFHVSAPSPQPLYAAR